MVYMWHTMYIFYFYIYGVSVSSGLYGFYGGGRVCFDCFCVGFVAGVGVRCLAVGFGAFIGDISILYTYIHIYPY